RTGLRRRRARVATLAPRTRRGVLGALRAFRAALGVRRGWRGRGGAGVAFQHLVDGVHGLRQAFVVLLRLEPRDEPVPDLVAGPARKQPFAGLGAGADLQVRRVLADQDRDAVHLGLSEPFQGPLVEEVVAVFARQAVLGPVAGLGAGQRWERFIEHVHAE